MNNHKYTYTRGYVFFWTFLPGRNVEMPQTIIETMHHVAFLHSKRIISLALIKYIYHFHIGQSLRILMPIINFTRHRDIKIKNRNANAINGKKQFDNRNIIHTRVENQSISVEIGKSETETIALVRWVVFECSCIIFWRLSKVWWWPDPVYALMDGLSYCFWNYCMSTIWADMSLPRARCGGHCEKVEEWVIGELDIYQVQYKKRNAGRC